MDSSVSPKDEILFRRVCHHIANAVYYSLFPVISATQGQMRYCAMAKDLFCIEFLSYSVSEITLPIVFANTTITR